MSDDRQDSRAMRTSTTPTTGKRPYGGAHLRIAPGTAAPRVLVVVATYNEIENLPRLVARIQEELPTADILVIDDNSPDGTGQWCDDRAAADSRLRCLRREGKLGLGTAHVAGMKHAIEHGYDYLVNMDADFSHDPRHLPTLVSGIDSAEGQPVDVMIGSRYVPGGKIEGWPLKRHIMSRGVNFYARLLLGIPARDTSGAFRAYRVSKLAELNFDRLLSSGYSFQEEVLWRLSRMGCHVAETPITFVERVHGRSKIDLGEVMAAIGVILKLAGERAFGRVRGKSPRADSSRAERTIE